MRIVQLANFWTPTSGGLRVVMDHLAAGYAERGHRVLQVVPGPHDGQHLAPWGRRATVASPTIPAAGGYRMTVRLRHVERLVEAFDADLVEVSDRATLAHLAGRWAHGARRVTIVAHERLDRILGSGTYGRALDAPVVRRISDRWNRRCRRAVDEVVAPSRYAAEEWRRVGITPRIVPWGVDTDRFSPPAVLPPAGTLRLAWVGRLSAEKRPDLAVGTARELCVLGVPTRLVVIGDGPLAPRLAELARGLPVDFAGHVSDPVTIASLLRGCHVSLSTSGIETFGLAVLESLACGTPVVACTGGAAGEVAAHAGRVVPADPRALAAGALALWHDGAARDAARSHARRFTWDRSVDAMLHALAGAGFAA